MGKTSKVLSATSVGFDGRIIEVECDITKGLPAIRIVGLANRSVDEARERIKSAITNSLLEYPARHITINLAPAELPKDGTAFDLPIAISVLASSGQLRDNDIADSAFVGELTLSGELRPIRGVISIVEALVKEGVKTLYIPKDNLGQALLIDGITPIGVTSLKELYLHLKKERVIPEVTIVPQESTPTHQQPDVTFDDIDGQEQAKRALLIAAAGRHNILFTGPPGTGKTMLGHALVNLMPAPSKSEQVTITKIHSLAGEAIDHNILFRPFRSPHHTSSRTALIGGGPYPKPGEVSLAHAGVLFLDEIPEFPRSTLESLRQPLEDHHVTIARAAGNAKFPASFMLVATMNPCPCGYFGDPKIECKCSQSQISNYQNKLSGPFLDRIDMRIVVPRVPYKTLLGKTSQSHKQHDEAVNLVIRASNIQSNRYHSSDIYNNSLNSSQIKRFASETKQAHELLINAADKIGLSARAMFKVLKVARTIADIDDSLQVMPQHISEALQYR